MLHLMNYAYLMNYISQQVRGQSSYITKKMLYRFTVMSARKIIFHSCQENHAAAPRDMCRRVSCDSREMAGTFSSAPRVTETNCVP